MGGLLILAAIAIPTLLWGDIRNPIVLIALVSTVYMGMLGGIDDVLKLRRGKTGLRGRWKLMAQVLFGMGLGVYMMNSASFEGFATTTTVPFLSRVTLDWGWFYIPLAALIFTGTTNAVNLADGLDGLAVGLALFCFIAFAALAYITGNADLRRVPADRVRAWRWRADRVLDGGRRGLPRLPLVQQPSRPGLHGRHRIDGARWRPRRAWPSSPSTELLLVVVGGVFVVEALSWFIQVISFRTRGKRVFRMAPIHHHFELLGLAREQGRDPLLDRRRALRAAVDLHAEAAVRTKVRGLQILPRNGDWSGARVGVLGLGRSGRGAVRLLERCGAEAIAFEDRIDPSTMDALAGGRAWPCRTPVGSTGRGGTRAGSRRPRGEPGRTRGSPDGGRRRRGWPDGDLGTRARLAPDRRGSDRGDRHQRQEHDGHD